MGPIRKCFNQSHIVPFQLVHNKAKSCDDELPHHLHEWHEIIVVHQGTCTFFIDDCFFELASGDIVIVPGNSIHCSLLDKGKTVTTSALYFCPSLLASMIGSESDSLHSLFTTAKTTKQYRYYMEREKRAFLAGLFDEIAKETAVADLYSGETVALLIRYAIVFVSRNCGTAQEKLSPLVPAWIKESLAYIDAHLHEELDLKMLAAHACVHPSYFSKKFKASIGLTYIEFLKSKRLVKAKDLLKTTALSIQAIAEACGYHSMPHFYRTFRAATGTTPAAYRKNS
ncbi:hypothetical protein CHH77_16355 [Shouchella clausii]|uniref:helix-turn-helix domain-containing protein n=1 Tax=Shouchella clausii TaxID=79880 RepID=UPI000BA5486D|nr:helix-turn-helix domain-containing protein [Shouchella clausii]PAE80588.1 hypothetical protein CHH77_16355 [Shouchella clausii]